MIKLDNDKYEYRSVGSMKEYRDLITIGYVHWITAFIDDNNLFIKNKEVYNKLLSRGVRGITNKPSNQYDKSYAILRMDKVLFNQLKIKQKEQREKK